MERAPFEAGHDMFRDSARRFFQAEVGPHAERWREQGGVDRVSRAHTLTDCLDASILDETDPERRDPGLDLYDPAVGPNGRKPRCCYLGDPRIVNNDPVGLARFCTLRSWLSQWSYDLSNADRARCLARVRVPVLVVGNGADDAATPSHTHAVQCGLAR